jgi:hypothetical protein
MTLRRKWLVPLLVLATLQSLGNVHCVGSILASTSTGCAMPIALPAEAPRTTATSPARGHECCAKDIAPAGPASPVAAEADAPSAVPASAPLRDCPCPCMRHPVATPVADVFLAAPQLTRALAVEAVAAATPELALVVASHGLQPADGPPKAAPPPDRVAPRGPPALV